MKHADTSPRYLAGILARTGAGICIPAIFTLLQASRHPPAIRGLCAV